MLLEWIELHSLLGVSQIFIYNHSLTPEVNRVLLSYRDDHVTSVNVIPWQLVSGVDVDYFSQHEALNDCVYRAASHGHQYAAVNDIDEVLVPRRNGHVTWPDFINDVTKRSTDFDKIGVYLFQHAYFRRNKTSDTEPYLVSMQSLWRTVDVTPAGKIRSKALYNVDKVLKVNIHSPYKLIDGATEIILKPSDGILHHYRATPMESFNKYPDKYKFIEDNLLTMFNERLSTSVMRRIHKLRQLV